jgi:hypothetical protein
VSLSTCGRHMRLNLPDAFYHHDVFQNAGRGLAVHIRQFENSCGASGSDERHRPIVGDQAMALAFPQFPRRRVFIEAGAVDGPAVEAPLPSLFFPKTMGSFRRVVKLFGWRIL